MKKLITLFFIASYFSLHALTILDERTGTVTSTNPSYDTNPIYHNPFYQQPKQDNSLKARYYRGEISLSEYMDSTRNLPKYESYDVTPTGRNSYNIKRIY